MPMERKLGWPAAARALMGLAALHAWSLGAQGEGPPSRQLRPTTAAYAGYSEASLDRVRERLAARGERCDLIFIGDSITDFFEPSNPSPRLDIWRQHYGHRHALNFGKQGDGTQAVLWRLENLGVERFSPRVAVLKIGTNNLGKYTPQEIAAGIQAVLMKIRTLWPDAKVILVGITPRCVKGEAAEINAKPAQVNAITRAWDDDKDLFYFDLAALMPPQPGKDGGPSFRGLANDRLHFDAEGYRLWAEGMEPLLARLLGDEPVAPASVPEPKH